MVPEREPSASVEGPVQGRSKVAASRSPSELAWRELEKMALRCKITGTKKRLTIAKENERNATGNFLKEFVPSETIFRGAPGV